jgi:hypothetical protein
MILTYNYLDRVINYYKPTFNWGHHPVNFIFLIVIFCANQIPSLPDGDAVHGADVDSSFAAPTTLEGSNMLKPYE